MPFLSRMMWVKAGRRGDSRWARRQACLDAASDAITPTPGGQLDSEVAHGVNVHIIRGSRPFSRHGGPGEEHLGAARRRVLREVVIDLTNDPGPGEVWQEEVCYG